jgi:hypothetical protein
VFRFLLRRVPAHARLLLFRFLLCGAAQRYPMMLLWTVPSAPRSSSSATDSESPLNAAMCSGVRLHGRRRWGLGRRTPPIRRKRERRTCCRSGRSRRRRMRRAIGRFGDCRIAPHSAARCSHSCARWGRGEGWAPPPHHQEVPQSKMVPEHKTAHRPRGSTAFSSWVTVNGREYSERTGGTRHLALRSRIRQTCRTSETRGNGDCGRRRRREIGRLGNLAGERTGHGTWRRDRHGGAPACSIESACGAPDARA